MKIISLIIQAWHFSQVWDPLMVTAISLARRREDGQSLGSHSDFVSHSTGRLCVRNKLTLWEQGSFARSQGSLFIWSQAVPLTFICYNIILHSYTSDNSCWRIEAYFKFLFPPSHFWGIGTLYLMTIPLSDHTADWNYKYVWTPWSDHTADWGFLVIYPLVNSLRELGYCKRPWILFRFIYLWRLLMTPILWPLVLGTRPLV